MAVLFRALAYAAVFVGLILLFLPTQILSWSGVSRPDSMGLWQVAGLLVGVTGAALALWCVLTFAFVGRGTPAPFDPPRRLVVRGPYRFVRNPMVIGAALALAGAALFYESTPLFIFTAAFLVVAHIFVVSYEEPTLRRTFAEEYDAYSRQVRRWWPRIRGDAGPG